MLTMAKISTGSSHAAHYYSGTRSGKSAAGAQAIKSTWLGQGSNRLGFHGPVSRDDFQSALAGYGPSHTPLFIRKKANRLPALDLTFSAPKSLSILVLMAEAKDLYRAHLEAVAKTVEAIEGTVGVIIRSERKPYVVETENLVAAQFDHQLSRHNQPQIHAHVIIFNTTWHEGRWRSLRTKGLFDTVKQWGQYYRDRLAESVLALGYRLRKTGEGLWELAKVPQLVLDYFSRRRNEIEQLVGPDASSRERQWAAIKLRPHKKEVPLLELKAQWLEQVNTLEKEAAAQKEKAGAERERE